MLKLAIKDLKLIIHDRRAVILTLIVPIALISLFAFAFGGSGKSNDTNPISIFISDQDSTDVSLNVISKLDTLKSLDVKLLPLVNAKEEVKKGNRVAVLALYKGFKDSVESGKNYPMELFYDQSRQIEAGLLQQVLFSNLMSIVGTKSIKGRINKMIDEQNPGLSKKELDDIHSKVDEQVSEFETGDKKSDKNFMGMKTTPMFSKSENNNLGLVQAVAGVAIMMLLFSVTGMGSGMLTEKEEGTLKKLLYSPIKPSSILFGKMLSTIIVSIIQLTVMFIFTWLAFGLDIFIDIPSLIVMILSTAFACASFGIFIASIAKTRKQVESFSTLVILIMSAIGGSMVPIFIMPAIMQKIAVVSVNYWSIQGFYDIFWRHLPISDVMTRVVVLVGIGIFMMAISIRNFNKNILDIA